MPTLGLQPGDDLTPEEWVYVTCAVCQQRMSLSKFRSEGCCPYPAAPRRSLWERTKGLFKKLARSPVQPGIITDRSGESRPGITFKKPL